MSQQAQVKEQFEQQRLKDKQWAECIARLSRMRARQQQAYELAEFGGDHDDEC